MANRADVLAASPNIIHFNGAGTNYLVETPAGVLYLIYIDANQDVAFKKSLNGGLTWTVPTGIFTGSATRLAVWFDRWSGINAGLIHIAWDETVTDLARYRTIDTDSSDALSTETTIFTGASAGGGGFISIARAVGGNVYCRAAIDAAGEGGFFRLPNANVPNGAWDAARTIDEANGTDDQMILLPDYDAADNQDMLAIFYDASADELSRKLYDDSGNSWGETSIATSIVHPAATTAFPHFAAAMDIANTRHILVAWSAVDTADADLRCWTIDSGAITEVTNVVLNSVDDQGLCGIALDTVNNVWHVFYGGASGGGETFPSAMNIYTKGSADGGTTWGPETLVTVAPLNIPWLYTVPRFSGVAKKGQPPVAFYSDATVDELMVSVSLLQPRAAHQLIGG